ncbi:MAG TPA: non-heme iron oxygenase ferredoxin subunit [bacterium]|jgi:3-phenylpropionate/trans-cinnamate dioxygenase ferredoxin subunit|nr:non-heme iron oxygenase ferredoxin subunit [bacterium]
MDNYITVGKLSEVPSGRAKVVTVNGRRLALCNVDGTIHVIDDRCTHDDGPLGEGTLHGHAIECPRHGARFDVRTGAVLRMPAAFPVKAYKSRVEGDEIQVEL